MNPLRQLVQRIVLPDAQQYLTLYLIALLFALMASWPTAAAPVNDAWFALAYARAAALGLLSLGYGATLAAADRREQRLVAAMLALFALLALPLEIAAYAASYPATALSWVLPLPALTALAMYALGLLLGKVLLAIRLHPLIPIVVPAALAGMVALDMTIGVNLLNPFTAAVRVSWPHLTMLLLAVLTLFVFLSQRIQKEAV
ncbi:MAG: hypothetical protein WD273_09585 [Trueperaceae bacterium]